MAERYVSPGQISKGQRGGNLWLSAVFGAGLIIPSYNAVTVQLAGHDDDGNPVDSWGTGLIIDHNHVITNKHVVTGLAGTSTGLSIYPSRNHADAERVDCSGTAHPHPTLDVAVIKFDLPEGKYIPRLAGMAFRDPDWADEVYVFGYPPWAPTYVQDQVRQAASDRQYSAAVPSCRRALGIPAAYRAAKGSGGTFVGGGLFGTRWAGLVVRMTEHSRLDSGSPRLNTLRALPMKAAVGTARRCQRGFQSALPPKRSSAARNSAGR